MHAPKATVAMDSSPATGPLSGVISEDLLKRARSGDNRALEHLFTRFLPRLRFWAHGKVPAWARHSVDTGDIIQDSILQAYRNLDSFEGGKGALFGYLRHVLLNRIRGQFRYASRHLGTENLTPDLDDARVDPGASPLDSAINEEDRQRYAAALRKLKSSDRNAIVGRVELGYSYEQLALVLNRPTAESARLAVRRALLRLGDEMRRG